MDCYFYRVMEKNKYHVIGVMSGTSLDGIDLVEVEFVFNTSWHFKILNAETIDYNEEWQEILEGLVLTSKERLYVIDADYTAYLSEKINDFKERYSIRNLDAVCSHGHTALHQPDNRLTFQIGNLPILSKLLNEKVVCDFRVQDVELGGQGAPLVPIGDKLLFSEYDYCLNLGGFANISMDLKDLRIAYDVCPVNIVLNHYVKQLGFNYDDKGRLAASGTLNKELLESLNNIEFYKKDFPKSLGLEWVNKEVFPLIDGFQLEVQDVLRTCVEHMAIQIVSQLQTIENASVLVSGGGVFNTFLIQRMKANFNGSIIIPSENVIDFKEAVIFGFLGVLKLRNEVNCLQSVTGASKDHSSGEIFLP
jgi:anhydro-N-acetylmuramic acid kinase